MPNLTSYGPSNLEVLLLLCFIVVLTVVAYVLLRYRWQEKERQLQTTLDDCQHQHELAIRGLQAELVELRARCDPDYIKSLQDHHQQIIAHEYKNGLYNIASQCETMMTGLRSDQPEMKTKLRLIRAKTYDMIQHTGNVVALPKLEQNVKQQELAYLRGLLEKTLKDIFPYAEASGVSLRPELASLEPISVNRLLIEQLCSNVIHNAIKYSSPGGVVWITLRLNEHAKQAEIEVRDQGRGIPEKEQEKIFELHTRADGLIEQGSGLGLYYAREIARHHGGDLVLGKSHVKEGSTFLITLPYLEERSAPKI